MRYKSSGYALVILLVSCGPVFQTHYTFSPPKGQLGINCITQCEGTKQQCRQIEQMKYELCEQRAEADYYRCQAIESARNKKKDDWWSGCYRASCYSENEMCEVNYRICYQNCGGTVLGETVCVANCEEVR